MRPRWVPSTAALATLFAFSPAAPANDEPPAYEDKLIEGGALAPEVSEELGVYNPDGLPRSWRIEGFASRVESGDSKRYENGMLLSARIDTAAYGAFSVDATVRGRVSGSTSDVFTIWQRGMPFEGGWLANNAVGMVNSPSIDLSRSQYRFFLPTFPLTGLTTEWQRQGRLQLLASIGEPGTYNGLRLAGFSGLGGRLATAAMQWNAAPDFRAGVQVVDARDVEAGFDAGSAATRTSARALYGAMAIGQGSDRLQVNALDSETDERRHNMGLWVDGESVRGRWRHNYGAFRFEPDLTWGYSPINRDLQGAYYRVNYGSAQWIASGGVDSVGSVTGKGTEGVFATGSLRYQASQTLGVGGGASARRSGIDASSAYLFLDKVTRYGTTRLQLDGATAQGGQRSDQLTVDQSWPLQAGLRLSTSLAVGEDRTPGRLTRRGGIAAFGGWDITNTLSLDGSARWTVESEQSRRNGRFANVGLVWRITPRWSLLGTYYDNRVETPLLTFTGIAPVIPVDNLVVVPRDRAIFLTLRYEDHAGTPVAPLGGVPGSGAGSLVGYIFYDANDDGRREAGEKGAANVTVVLDGRFGTRSDNDGRFEFPLVSSGPHAITVIPDNLALPYAVSDEGRRDVVIRTRETTLLEIAAQRVK